MKKLFLLILLLNASFAYAQLIHFDDLGGGPIPNPYNGLNFTVGYSGNGVGLGGGYTNNMVSPPNVAYNGFAAFPWDIISVGGPKTFTSLRLGAAWNTNEMVQISPIGGAQPPINVTVNCTGPSTLVNLNWSGITGIRITLVSAGSGGVCGGGGGEHLVLDNLQLDAPVTAIPTLGEWGLIIFSLVLIALGTVVLRYRRSFRLGGIGN